MSKEQTVPAAVPAPAKEERIDEFSISMFNALGFEGKLPDSLVSFFNEFKRRKDSIHPGRLGPEWYTMISMMHDMQLDAPAVVKAPGKERE